MKMLVLVVTLAAMTPIAAMGGERDWTVEHPVLAGFATGLTLTVCRSCRLGAASVPANPNDPFAMSPSVKQRLIVLGHRPFLIGSTMGFLYAFIVLGGIFAWRLNTLKVRKLIESRA